MDKLHTEHQPKNEKDYDLQIVICSGLKNLERATLGFATALAAASTTTHIVVFLTMDGIIFSQTGSFPHVSSYLAINNYIDLLLEQNVKIEYCATCYTNQCLSDKECNLEIRTGLVKSGIATMAIRAINTQTIVF